MDLKQRVYILPSEKQKLFFEQAAKFFSNRELKDIITLIQSGNNLFESHVKSGVFEKYAVDLNKLI